MRPEVHAAPSNRAAKTPDKTLQSQNTKPAENIDGFVSGLMAPEGAIFY